MARYNRFTFLVNRDERRMIADMAQRLQRKEADAVRFVVLEAARALEATDQAQPMTAQPTTAQGAQRVNG